MVIKTQFSELQFIFFAQRRVICSMRMSYKKILSCQHAKKTWQVKQKIQSFMFAINAPTRANREWWKTNKKAPIHGNYLTKNGY